MKNERFLASESLGEVDRPTLDAAESWVPPIAAPLGSYSTPVIVASLADWKNSQESRSQQFHAHNEVPGADYIWEREPMSMLVHMRFMDVEVVVVGFEPSSGS
jgi:hypothetical protein